jgi:hypothetical protein
MDNLPTILFGVSFDLAAVQNLQRQHLNGALNQPLTGRIAAAGGGVEAPLLCRCRRLGT